MTVGKEFVSWQNPGLGWSLKYKTDSPNLVALCSTLIKRFGGTNVGIFMKRPIKGGTAPSTHSFGAALDWKYPSRQTVLQTVLPWLIDNSQELGVQAIHDYLASRIWRPTHPGDGWQKQPKDQFGMGQKWGTWLHIETTPSQWSNSSPVENRGINLP